MSVYIVVAGHMPPGSCCSKQIQDASVPTAGVASSYSSCAHSSTPR